MRTSEQRHANALLQAAEQSLLDANARLEQALRALELGTDAEAQTLLGHVRLYSSLIQRRLDRLSPAVTCSAA
jgi:hypothetical protein